MDENLCRKCGECCRVTIRVNGRVQKTNQFCPFHDGKTKLCLVYDRRKQACPICLDVEEALKRRLLPKKCGYVKGLKCYAPIWVTQKPKDGPESCPSS